MVVFPFHSGHLWKLRGLPSIRGRRYLSTAGAAGGDTWAEAGACRLGLDVLGAGAGAYASGTGETGGVQTPDGDGCDKWGRLGCWNVWKKNMENCFGSPEDGGLTSWTTISILTVKMFCVVLPNDTSRTMRVFTTVESDGVHNPTRLKGAEAGWLIKSQTISYSPYLQTIDYCFTVFSRLDEFPDSDTLPNATGTSKLWGHRHRLPMASILRQFVEKLGKDVSWLTVVHVVVHGRV